MDLLSLAAESFVVALSGAAAPGPLMLTVIRESAGRNARVGVLLSTGHALLEMPMVILLALGLMSIDVTQVLFWLGLLGGTVLIAFGALTLKSSMKPDLFSEGVSSTSRTSNARLVALGSIASMSNPYWTLWWMAIGAAYIARATLLGGSGVLIFYIGHILGDAFVFVTISALTAGTGRALGGKGYRLVLIVTGLLLVALGANFVLSALGYL